MTHVFFILPGESVWFLSRETWRQFGHGGRHLWLDEESKLYWHFEGAHQITTGAVVAVTGILQRMAIHPFGHPNPVSAERKKNSRFFKMSNFKKTLAIYSTVFRGIILPNYMGIRINQVFNDFKCLRITKFIPTQMFFSQKLLQGPFVWKALPAKQKLGVSAGFCGWLQFWWYIHARSCMFFGKNTMVKQFEKNPW